MEFSGGNDVKEQIQASLADPLVKETIAAIEAQGLTPPGDMSEDEGLLRFAEFGMLDPVLTSAVVALMAQVENTKPLDLARLPQQVGELAGFLDGLQNDPFEAIPVILESGRPWSPKLGITVFMQAIAASLFSSSSNVERMRQDIADAAVTVMDSLTEKGTWKEVPPKLMSEFLLIVNEIAQDEKIGRALGRVLNNSLRDLKQAMAQDTAAEMTEKPVAAEPKPPKAGKNFTFF